MNLQYLPNVFATAESNGLHMPTLREVIFIDYIGYLHENLYPSIPIRGNCRTKFNDNSGEGKGMLNQMANITLTHRQKQAIYYLAEKMSNNFNIPFAKLNAVDTQPKYCYTSRGTTPFMNSQPPKSY